MSEYMPKFDVVGILAVVIILGGIGYAFTLHEEKTPTTLRSDEAAELHRIVTDLDARLRAVESGDVKWRGK